MTIGHATVIPIGDDDEQPTPEFYQSVSPSRTTGMTDSHHHDALINGGGEGGQSRLDKNSILKNGNVSLSFQYLLQSNLKSTQSTRPRRTIMVDFVPTIHQPHSVHHLDRQLRLQFLFLGLMTLK